MPTATGPIPTRIRTKEYRWLVRRRGMSALRKAMIVAAAGTALLAQPGGRVAPFWPEDGRVPPEMERQYVFITKEGDALMVRLPKEPGGPLTGEKKVVRIQLYNRFEPEVNLTEVSIAPSGRYRYTYKVCNSRTAKDAIDLFGLILPPTRERFPMTHTLDTGMPWPGIVSVMSVAVQMALDGVTKGNYADWTKQPASPAIEPGKCLEGFTIETPNAPGFLTAYVRSLKIPEYQLAWEPDEVSAQLGVLDARPFREKYALTLGPMFPPGTQPAEMARNFQQGLRQLIKQGRISSDSALVAEVMDGLAKILQAESTPVAVHIRSKPSTSLEAMLLKALEFSLRIRTADE